MRGGAGGDSVPPRRRRKKNGPVWASETRAARVRTIVNGLRPGIDRVHPHLRIPRNTLPSLTSRGSGRIGG